MVSLAVTAAECMREVAVGKETAMLRPPGKDSGSKTETVSQWFVLVYARVWVWVCGGVIYIRYVHMPKLAHFWKPFSAHFDMPIKPKLAETALLLCRVTDVPFLPKMEPQNKISRNRHSW